jgi:outer membrane protein TolC
MMLTPDPRGIKAPLDAHGEVLHVVQARFEEGRANLRDVEKLRLDESTKWLAFLDADYDNQQAALELLRLSGQLAAVLQ